MNNLNESAHKFYKAFEAAHGRYSVASSWLTWSPEARALRTAIERSDREQLVQAWSVIQSYHKVLDQKHWVHMGQLVDFEHSILSVLRKDDAKALQFIVEQLGINWVMQKGRFNQMISNGVSVVQHGNNDLNLYHMAWFKGALNCVRTLEHLCSSHIEKHNVFRVCMRLCYGLPVERWDYESIGPDQWTYAVLLGKHAVIEEMLLRTQCLQEQAVEALRDEAQLSAALRQLGQQDMSCMSLVNEPCALLQQVDAKLMEWMGSQLQCMEQAYSSDRGWLKSYIDSRWDDWAQQCVDEYEHWVSQQDAHKQEESPQAYPSISKQQLLKLWKNNIRSCNSRSDTGKQMSAWIQTLQVPLQQCIRAQWYRALEKKDSVVHMYAQHVHEQCAKMVPISGLLLDVDVPLAKALLQWGAQECAHTLKSPFPLCIDIGVNKMFERSEDALWHLCARYEHEKWPTGDIVMAVAHKNLLKSNTKCSKKDYMDDLIDQIEPYLDPTRLFGWIKRIEWMMSPKEHFEQQVQQRVVQWQQKNQHWFEQYIQVPRGSVNPQSPGHIKVPKECVFIMPTAHTLRQEYIDQIKNDPILRLPIVLKHTAQYQHLGLENSTLDPKTKTKSIQDGLDAAQRSAHMQLMQQLYHSYLHHVQEGKSSTQCSVPNSWIQSYASLMGGTQIVPLTVSSCIQWLEARSNKIHLSSQLQEHEKQVQKQQKRQQRQERKQNHIAQGTEVGKMELPDTALTSKSSVQNEEVPKIKKVRML